jgi:fatty-acyl-CoA synthase
LNLHGCIAAWAAQAPHKTALHFEGTAISYASFRDTVLARAEKFRALGVERGDRVAFLGYNHPELLYALFACARLGAILVPLNWRLSAHR